MLYWIVSEDMEKLFFHVFLKKASPLSAGDAALLFHSCEMLRFNPHSNQISGLPASERNVQRPGAHCEERLNPPGDPRIHCKKVHLAGLESGCFKAP